MIASSLALVASLGYGRAANGCAPGTTCLSANANGASAAGPGPYTAQCTGKFPDYIAASSLVPADGNGPWFKLSQNYPMSPPPLDAPWLGIDFTSGVQGADAYLYALRDYAFGGMITADFRPKANGARQWYHMPFMNFGPHPREPIHGVTSARSVVGPELGVNPGVTLHSYAIGFYIAAGGYAIGQVWSSSSPNIGGLVFGATAAPTCQQQVGNPPAKPLDFSLQMSVAVQSILQFHDVNPCTPALPALAPNSLSYSDAPRIERLTQSMQAAAVRLGKLK